jgi:hypothetical protein
MWLHARLSRAAPARVLCTMRSPAVRLALGLSAASALCLPLAFYAMFSGFRPYDDEGYLLVTLRYYARGAPLYDTLFAKYGPAYFQSLTALFAGLGLPYGHMSGRGVTLGFWVTTALASGLATYRLTRNVSVTLASYLVLFPILIPMRNEPPHPGGLAALLVAGVVLAASFLRETSRPAAAAGLGILLGLATLTKINVGLFALVSAVFGMLAVGAGGRAGRPLRLGAALTFVATAPAVTAGLVALPWVRTFLGVVVSATLSVALVVMGRTGRRVGAVPDVLVLLGTWAGTIVASCAWEVRRGTTVAGLVQGILLDPIHHPVDNVWPLDLSPWVAGWALTLLGLALLFVGARSRGWAAGRGGERGLGLLQVAAGLGIWLVVSETLALNPLGVTLPLLWIALIRRCEGTDRDRKPGRVVLVATAALQALHAYPVAGSQVAWATFLLAPVGAVALADGWETLAATRRSTGSGAPFLRRAAPGVVAILLVALPAWWLYDVERLFWSTYHGGVPLALPGASGIHLPPGQAAVLRRLSERVAAECRTFVTWPGFASLYLFTRLEPPSMLATVAGMTTLSAAREAEVVDAVDRLPGPMCAVTQAVPAAGASPLKRAIDAGFETAFRVDRYVLKVRRPATSGSSERSTGSARGGRGPSIGATS